MTTWRPSQDRSEQAPKPLSESLDRLTRRLGGPKASTLATVFASWEQLVGPDIAGHSRPESLRDGLLTMVVDHPAWAAQLRYMTTDMMTRIGEVTGGGEVTDIRIKVSGQAPARPARGGGHHRL